MFWITNDKNNPLIETVYFLEEKKGKYPHILINKITNNVKYNDMCGIILKKEKKILWEDGKEWILAPKNIEYVEGYFKDIMSFCNMDVDVPMRYYKYSENYKTHEEKYIKGKIVGLCENKTFNVLIGKCYYGYIIPGDLIIRMPRFN